MESDGDRHDDAHRRRDDGLRASAAHPFRASERHWTLERIGCAGPLWFDSLSDAGGPGPVSERSETIGAVEGMKRVLDRLRGGAAAR